MGFSFQKVKFDTAYGFGKQLPKSDKGEVVFIGRSNVGKSSLLNKIANQKNLARVSSVPGKTTTINVFSVSDNVIFVDLPGYGYAKRSDAEKKRWEDLMGKFFSSGRNIVLAMQLLDMRHEPSEDDRIMLQYLIENNIPFVAVLTKSDKLNKTEFKEHLEYFEQELKYYRPLKIMPFTSQKNEPAEEMRKFLIEYLELDK